MMTIPPLTLQEGWHVLHLFYRVDREGWEKLSADQKETGRQNLVMTIQKARGLGQTQVLTYSIVGQKADLGVILIGPDLQALDVISKDIGRAFPAGCLQPAFSYVSLTESSEYTITDEEQAATLQREEKLVPGTPEFEQRMAQFRERMKKYAFDRIYPKPPEFAAMAFYPMSKSRGEIKNWFALSYEERRKLMHGHGKVGRKYAGKILQVITGSTGLDDWEWGVTLFSNDLTHIKNIVYEMRFDEVSALYGIFGPFFIGLRMEPEDLINRLNL